MKMTIKSLIFKQLFFPTFIGIFLNPFYFARSGLARSISKHAPEFSGKLLDIGCGKKPYKNQFNVDEYIGLEIDSPESRNRGIADYYYDGKSIPFKSNTFDCAICNQVLEHVFNPSQFISEINRVLKPGGRLLLTVPFVWDEHEQPYDYARYSSFGLQSLFRENGFIIHKHEKLGADASILFQMTNIYLYKISATWPKFLRIIFIIFIMGFVNLCGLIAKYLLPKNNDFYLDNIIIVEKNEPRISK